jgi:hypothetical protein
MMQYVVRGNLKTSDDTKIKGVINKYRSLDKESLASHTDEVGQPRFTFELKTKDLSKKNGMFADFKALVDEYNGEIDWHECRHDEGNNACSLAEEYRR